MSHYSEQIEADIIHDNYKRSRKPVIRILTDKYLVARTKEKMNSGIEVRETDSFELACDLVKSMC